MKMEDPDEQPHEGILIPIDSRSQIDQSSSRKGSE